MSSTPLSRIISATLATSISGVAVAAVVVFLSQLTYFALNQPALSDRGREVMAGILSGYYLRQRIEAAGLRIFGYVAALAKDQGPTRGAQNVFVNSLQQHRDGVMFSRTGRTETAPNGDRFLVLEDGRRYDGQPGTADYRVMEFERYATRIQEQAAREPARSRQALSTLELIRHPTNENRGELVWRFGVPLAALLLSLLAIPMSFVNPRAGRSVNLAFALLTYVVYSNLLSVTQSRVATGKLDFAVGVWLMHGVMLVLLVVMFAYRLQPLGLRRGIRRVRRA